MPNEYAILDRPQMAALDADGLPPDISVETWAALQAIPVGRRVVGRRYGVRQPVCANGTHGTIWTWTGTLFRPAGQQLVFSSNALVTNGAGPSTTEWIARSILFDVGVLAGARIVSSATGFDRSTADTNANNHRERIGITGTTADTNFCTQTNGVADLQWNFANRWTPISSTSVVNRPNDAGFGGGNNNGFDTKFGSSAARGPAFTVSDLSKNSLYYSITLQQGGTPLATMSSSYCHLWVE